MAYFFFMQHGHIVVIAFTVVVVYGDSTAHIATSRSSSEMLL